MADLTTSLAHIRAVELRPSGGVNRLKTAETRVVVRNRGGGPIVDMYDGYDWKIPDDGQDYIIPYAVAMHLKSRAVAPGSRNPETNKITSRLAIVCVADWDEPIDKPELCEPFTFTELARMAGTEEAIDRSAVASPEGRRAKPMKTADALAAVYAKGINPDAQSLNERKAAAAPVAPEDNEAMREIAEDTGQPVRRRK